MPPDVALRFAAYPQSVRDSLMTLRGLIFETAQMTAGVGVLTETLKWNEPAYLTTGCGTTIRLGWNKRLPNQCALLVNCQTSLVASYRSLFPGLLTFQGNRAISLPLTGDWPIAALGHCIQRALTYHKTQPAATKPTGA